MKSSCPESTKDPIISLRKHCNMCLKLEQFSIENSTVGHILKMKKDRQHSLPRKTLSKKKNNW